ncbi:hypothetical protein PCH_Pc22g24740 [Penicillium rubens Wisconsin 54-1255]|uniref:Uncharacterized protein n=1 Tax=Penicillium rubens (strain ATCC 28089 / DSM 1075 / NRRL 1951 / Wisconsin 54-1255) TaxID=500485 RepID=B6HR89_PENRW|nr:hypothetical protein PCH_Pc22g24740 [Penicillium rubens Wisconsin 54-1255]
MASSVAQPRQFGVSRVAAISVSNARRSKSVKIMHGNFTFRIVADRRERQNTGPLGAVCRLRTRPAATGGHCNSNYGSRYELAIVEKRAMLERRLNDVGRGSDRTTRLLRQAEGELQQATNTKTLCTVLRNTRRQSLWLVVLAGSMIGGRSAMVAIARLMGEKSEITTHARYSKRDRQSFTC